MLFRKLNSPKIIYVLLLLFVVNAIFAYDDYGFSMDEAYQRRHAVTVYRWMNRTLLNRGVFINEASENLSEYQDRFYGVALQMPMVIAEDVCQRLSGNEMSFRQKYQMRHIYLHCLFLAALLLFFWMLYDLFEKPLLAAAGVLMIYVFGRFFADSFYNIKDLLFASVSMAELFCAERLLKNERNTKWCILFAISTAFLCTSRIVGALYAVLLILIMVIDDIRNRRRFNFRPYLIICSSLFIWLLITPASWTDPFQYILGCITRFSDYPWDGTKFFGGQLLTAKGTPPDYYLRWIGITVPIVFLLLALIGLAVWFGKNKKIRTIPLRQMLTLSFSIFSVTILYQIIRKPTIYNAWRHVYFLYPLIILFAVYGLNELWLASRSGVARGALTGILAVSICYNGILLYLNHPFGFVSYNPVGQLVGTHYERDYWEAGTYEAIRWLAQYVPEHSTVTDLDITRDNFRSNYLMLTQEDQSKLQIPTVDTQYIIFRHGTDLYEDFVPENQRIIKEFSAYGIKQYTIFERIPEEEK